MNSSNLWGKYDSPPTQFTDVVGKKFLHREKNVEVKIIYSGLLVESVLGDEDRIQGFPIDTPACCIPIFTFQIMKGRYAGQILSMQTRIFFSMFSLVS